MPLEDSHAVYMAEYYGCYGCVFVLFMMHVCVSHHMLASILPLGVGAERCMTCLKSFFWMLAGLLVRVVP